MKKEQFSYMNGRALSHASLQKFRQQNAEPKVDKETFSSKPTIKYYVNSNQNKSTVAIKSEQRKLQKQKNEEQLKKRIKVLQYELKNKLSENSMMVKFFRTKNSSQIPHLDIYLELRKVEQQLLQKESNIQQLNSKIQQMSKQIQQMLQLKQQQDQRHTRQIHNCLQKLQKLQKKHTIQKEQKQKHLLQQRKKRQEKDELLKQIRKKYQESKQKIYNLQNSLQKIQKDKEQIQRVYKQRLQNTKQEKEIKIEEKRRQRFQLQKRIKQLLQKVKEQQQKITLTHQKYAERQLQKMKNIKSLQNQLNVGKKQLHEKTKIIEQLSQEREKYHKNIQKLQEQISQKNHTYQELTIKFSKNIQVAKNTKQQLQQARTHLKELQQKKQKALQQLKIAQHKLGETNAKNKSLMFQLQQRQVLIQKMKSNLIEKQRCIKQKQKQIQQIQCKMFNNQLKIANYTEKMRQMEKQMVNDKQLNQKQFMSKLQIQNYKSIGRLLELIHQVQALTSQSYQKSQQIQRRNRNNGGRNRKLQPQTITQCIDQLNKQLDLFVKFNYNPSRQQNKYHKQFIDQVTSDIKSLFHAYNSYIQDQQLKGATRQYLECLDNNDKTIKRKQRNSYLQVIMQRLISMIAIQSYTSDQGLKRQVQSRTRLSRKDIDSLENTYEYIEQNQQRQKGYRKKPLQIHQQRYSRNSHNKKRLSYNKAPTQPCQQYSNMRKLDYGKENILQRINKVQAGETNKYNYLSVQDKDRQRFNKYQMKYHENASGKEIGVLRKLKNYNKEDPDIKQVKKQKNITAKDEQIEKKYFR